MKFTKLICILLTVFTVLALASCGGNENSGAGSSSGEETTPAVTTTPEVTTPESSENNTDPVGSSSEEDTEPVTPPASSSESDTTPQGPVDDYVIPADGKITLGDGSNGIQYPFTAGVITGLTGDNFAVSAMSSLNKINWFTKVVNPIGGFTGNWQLTEDSNLNQFTAGNYGDIQMFYHIDANNNNWVFGPNCTKGQAIVIKFTAPLDGNYTYTVSGRDWTAASGGAVMDVHIGENMHNWWDMLRFTGNQHGSYVAQQVSSVKALTAGTNVYFIIRTAGGMDTITAISEFTITYTPAA